MSKKEKIVCAALKITWTGVLKLEHDVVLCGPSYDFIRRNGFYMNLKYGEFKETVNHEKGFITNKNRFVDPVNAMKIAVKTGQYPDYELMKRKALEEIGFAKENENHNESVGILGFKLFVADIPKLVSRVKELDKLLERNYLLPEDLY